MRSGAGTGFDSGVRRNKLVSLVAHAWRVLPFFVRERILLLTQSTFTIGVSAVLFNEAGEVLLVRHRFRYSSSWQLPGGFVRRGESLEGALQRELREELGVKVTVERQLGASLVRRQHLDVCFVCNTATEPLPDYRELLEVKFFPAVELPKGMANGVGETIGRAIEI